MHHALDLIDEDHNNYKTFIENLKTQANIKGKRLFLPLRFALTGQAHGPELSAMFTLMGAKQLRQRFQQALDTL